MLGRTVRALRAPVIAAWLGLSAAAWSQPAEPAQAPVKVQVQRFNVVGNSLLPAAALDAVLEPYRGERTLAELQAAARAVQDLYAQEGYGAVAAYLPPQQGAPGVVTIQVLEGRLSRIKVVGQRQFSTENIRASLPALAEGRTPRVRDLDAQIQLANENPAKQLRVLLQPGDQPGTAEAQVNVAEQPVQRWTVSADNTGNSRTGHARAGLAWQHANLSGIDDVASLQVQTGPSHPSRVKIFGAGYHVPFYGSRMTLDAYAAYSDVDSGSTSTPVGNLQFSGRGRAAGLRLGQLLPGSEMLSHRVFLGLDHRAYLNQCAISGLPDGACGSAGESVSVQPLSAEYLVQGTGALRWNASVSVQHNLRWGGHLAEAARFEAVRPGADPHYTSARLNGSVAWPLGESGLQLQARAAGQWTDDALVSGEQFGLGGVSSVRGYEERELSGDRGAFASLELAGPVWTVGEARLGLLAFADGGTVENRLDTACDAGRTRCTLAGAGVGARLDAGGLQARLYVAQALKAGPVTERHRTRAHAALAYSF